MIGPYTYVFKYSNTAQKTEDMCSYKQWESQRIYAVSISRLQHYIHFKISIPLSINLVEFKLKGR